MLKLREEIKTKAEKKGVKISGLESVPYIVQGRPLYDFAGIDQNLLKELGQDEDDLFMANGLMNIAVFPDGRVEPLKTVSKQYNLIQHLDAINQVIDNVPDEYKLDKIQVHTSNNGGRILAKLFSEKKTEVKKGDMVQLVSTLQNSADTSKLYRMMASAMRLVCTNGMVAPDSRFKLETVRKLHKGNLDLNTQIKGFFENMEEVAQSLDQWKEYNKVKVDTPIMDTIFERLEVGPRVQEELLDITLKGENNSVRNLLGDGKLTAWDTYNAFTQRITESDSEEHVKVERGAKVSEFFDNLVFAA